MKNFISIAFFFAFSISLSFGQTTSAEYDYVTTKFKIQLDNGLGDKEGYKSELYETVTIGERKVKLYALLQGSSRYDVRVAAYAAVYEYNGKKAYLCIPHPDSDQVLHDKFWKLAKGTYTWDQNSNKTKILARAMSYCLWETCD